MKINQDGLELTLFNDNLAEKFENFSKLREEKVEITAESLVANLLVSLAFMQASLENGIAYLLKQFDPETAEGEYQDALYSRVALKRIEASPTNFTLTVRGTAGTFVPAGDIFVEDSATKDLFYNTSELEFDESGLSTGVFRSYLSANIPVVSDLQIFEAPDNVDNVVQNSCQNIVLGNNEESDVEFKNRFHKIRNSVSKCSHDDILRNLSALTDGLEFISVNDNNSDEEIPAGTIEITARPVVSDEEFCKAIFENTIAGINYSGNTTVNISASNGQVVAISYNKAQPVDVYISAVIRLKYGFYRNSVFRNIREQIINYTNSKTYGLGKDVYSVEFISSILSVDGVEGLISLYVKRSDSAEYSDSAEISDLEYAQFDAENILLEVDE